MERAQRNVAGFGRSVTVAAGGLILALGMGLGGCSTNSRLAETNRALTDRNAALLQQLEQCEGSSGVMQDGLVERDRTIADLQRMVSGLTRSRDDLMGDIQEFDDRFRNMSFSQVDPQTDREMRTFAANNPDLVDYDSDLGMVRFKSDLTFALGKVAVSESAKASLSSLATVLNGAAAGRYDIRVVGHTDNVKVRSRNQWRNNIELSCFRAISVRNELIGLGIDESRVEAAGRGESQPLVANNPRGGTEPNRRVELFLVRSIASAARAIAAPAPSAAPGVTPSNATVGVPTDINK